MKPALRSPAAIRTLRRRLLQWYDRNRRALPWRADRSPYKVWLSEIMLQQTRVATALPFYERFLRRFPDVRSLASSSEEEVLALWAGLGYYSRGRNLLRAARRIVDEFGGEIPSELEDILSLPGVGRYTAGAIQSIAFDRREPVVDGNVKRVTARLHGAVSGLPEEFYWKQARAWVPARRPADFNQAMMELGALVCVPRNPRCRECPLELLCAARLAGTQGRIPAPRRRRRIEEIEVVVLLVSRDGKRLLCRRQRDSFIPGEWVLPMRVVEDSADPVGIARRFARQLLGRSSPLKTRGRVVHNITYRKITAHVFEAVRPPAGTVGPPLRWIPEEEATGLLTSSLFRKVRDSAMRHRARDGNLP